MAKKDSTKAPIPDKWGVDPDIAARLTRMMEAAKAMRVARHATSTAATSAGVGVAPVTEPSVTSYGEIKRRAGLYKAAAPDRSFSDGGFIDEPDVIVTEGEDDNEVVTEILERGDSRANAFVETFNEAIDGDDSVIVKTRADNSLAAKTLAAMGHTGWRTFTPGPGMVFRVGKMRITSRTVVLHLVPINPTGEWIAKRYQFAEVDIGKGQAVFEDSFDEMFRRVMGVSLKEALDAINGKVPIKAEPAKPEAPEGWGDW